MTEAIIAGLITGLASVVTSLIINNKNQAVINNEIEHIKDDLVEVKKKLDVHNGYAEKLGDIEITLAKMGKDIEYLKER